MRQLKSRAWPRGLLGLGIAALLACAAWATLVGAMRLIDPLDKAVQPASELALRGAGLPKAPVAGVARAGTRLVAVGARGLILVSVDAGGSWRQAPSPVSTDLVSVRFVSATTAWVVGHDAVILRSDDGGENWRRVHDGRSVLKLLREAYPAATAPKLAQEVEAGAQQSATADVWPAPFLDIWFENAQSGFAVGAFGLILRTSDGGQHWQPWLEHVDNEKRFHLYGMGGRPGQVYLAGEQGLLLRLNASGDRFERVETPYNGTYFGVQLVGANKLLAFGLRGNAFASDDAGLRWQKIETGVDSNLVAAIEADGDVLLVSQAGEVLALSPDAKTAKGQQVPAGGDVFAAVALADHRVAVARASGPAVMAWPASQ